MSKIWCIFLARATKHMMRPLCCIVLSAGKCTFDNAAMQTRLITHSSASPKPDVVSHLPYTVTVDINECIQGHCAKQAEAENRMRKSEKQNCLPKDKTCIFCIFLFLYLFHNSVSQWCSQCVNLQLSSLVFQVCQGFPACLGRRRNGWRSPPRLTLSTGSTRASIRGSRSSPGCRSNGRASWRTLPTAPSPWWTPPTSPPSSWHQWRYSVNGQRALNLGQIIVSYSSPHLSSSFCFSSTFTHNPALSFSHYFFPTTILTLLLLPFFLCLLTLYSSLTSMSLYLTTPSSTCYTSCCFSSQAKQIIL